MPLADWLRAFALTAAIEVPIVVALTRGARAKAPRRAVVALAAQLATHPLVWFVFPVVPGLTGWTSFALSELFAWVAEAALYAAAWEDVRPTRALAIAAVANGVSIAAGLALSG